MFVKQRTEELPGNARSKMNARHPPTNILIVKSTWRVSSRRDEPERKENLFPSNSRKKDVTL